MEHTTESLISLIYNWPSEAACEGNPTKTYQGVGQVGRGQILNALGTTV